MDSKFANFRNHIYSELGYGDSSFTKDLLEIIGNSSTKGSFEWQVEQIKKDKNLKRQTSEKNYWEHYFKNIFPISLKMFRAVANYQISLGTQDGRQKDAAENYKLPCLYPDFTKLENRYDIQISLVGFSPEPILHALFTLQPQKKIYLICSVDTKRFCNIDFNKFVELMIKENKFQLSDADECQQLDNIDYKNPNIDVCSIDPVDSSNADHVIGLVKEIVDAHKDERRRGKIAIDVTGGKKIMLAGAFTTASVFSLHGYYVDFQEYDDKEKGRPVYGTEFLSRLRNPLVDFEIYKKDPGLFNRIFRKGRLNVAEVKESRRVFLDAERELNKRVELVSRNTTGDRQDIELG